MKKHNTPLNHSTKKKTPKKALFGVLAFFILTFFVSALWYWNFSQKHALTFYPGVQVLDIDLSGMTSSEAKERISQKIKTMEDEGVELVFEDDGGKEHSLQIPPTIVAMDAASAERMMYSYDIDATISAAYAIGREGGRFQQLRDQWNSARKKESLPLAYTFQQDMITLVVDETFSQFETEAKNADISIDDDGKMTITKEIPGQGFDREKIVSEIQDAVANVEPKNIELTLSETLPFFTEEDIEKNRDQVSSYLETAPIILQYKDESWTFDADDIASWLSFQTNTLAVDPARLEESITAVHDAIYTTPQEGKFEPIIDENDAITDFRTLVEPQEGQAIDFEKTADGISTWIENASSGKDQEESIPVYVTTISPKYTKETIKNLGIVEVLGTGTSNMAGSPPNRVVNIQRGAELLDGLLIAPDEIFSLNEALRPYTAENGYLAELVIVGDKTIPEYGGGLCQIGTTTFRTTMNSGLDIIERAAHSYAVSYYFEENGLPGTDATIYDRVVDYKFKNDTGNYILLNTDIQEDGTLLFTMSGKSDGRKGSYTQPTISGWVAPPPVKEIETTDLAPGERDCSESAHDGTTAEFDYTVTYPDGTVREETFTSYYKPWQAVCRVGKEVEKPKEEEPEKNPVNEKEKGDEKEIDIENL